MAIIKSNSLLHFCEEDAGFGGKGLFLSLHLLSARSPSRRALFGLETKPGTFCPSTAITALAWSREEAQRKTKNAKLYHRNVVECVQALEKATEMPLLRRSERGELDYCVCEWWFVAFSREIVYKPVRALTAEWGRGVTWPVFSTSDRERDKRTFTVTWVHFRSVAPMMTDCFMRGKNILNLFCT